MYIRKLFLPILLISISSVTLHSQEMSFEEYNPKSTLVVPGKEVTKAKFPFIDVHSHQRSMSKESLSALIEDMDRLNEGIMVNLSGGSGENINAKIESINANYPNRFVVFANVSFDGVGEKGWTANAVTQLEKDVKNGAKGLKVYKSLGLRNKDVDGKR